MILVQTDGWMLYVKKGPLSCKNTNKICVTQHACYATHMWIRKNASNAASTEGLKAGFHQANFIVLDWLEWKIWVSTSFRKKILSPGSVKVRTFQTLPHGSDRIKSTGLCRFSHFRFKNLGLKCTLALLVWPLHTWLPRCRNDELTIVLWLLKSLKQSKAKMCNERRHVPLCPACANKKISSAKIAIILQCYHLHLSNFCSGPRLTQHYNHIIYPGVAKIYLLFFWKCLLYLLILLFLAGAGVKCEVRVCEVVKCVVRYEVGCDWSVASGSPRTLPNGN